MEKMTGKQAIERKGIWHIRRGRAGIAWGALVVLGMLACLLAVMQGASASGLSAASVPASQPSGQAKNNPGVASLDCGQAWSVMTTPNSTNSNYLYDVDVISDSDVWAVGSYSNLVGQHNVFQSLIEHWNGSAWSLITIPQFGVESTLYAVSAVSSSDIWAVGYYEPNSTTQSTLILHYNGSSWSQVTSPNTGADFNALYGVVAVSANSAWAVGGQSSQNVYGTTVLYWDGNNWASVPSPSPDHVDTLNDVTATSPDDMWAVGYSRGSEQGAYGHNLSIHCTRSECDVITTPNGGAGDNELARVKALSSSDVWAVGYNQVETYTQEYVPMMMHWDGVGWSMLPTPAVSSDPNRTSFSDVIPISDSAVWAVGSAYDLSTQTSQTYAALWNGSSWTMSNPSNLGTSNNFRGGDGLSATDIWAVGQSGNSTSSNTLAERYNDPCVTPTPTPPACSVDFTDVPQGSTFYPYVHCLSCQNILGGYTTGCPTGSPCFKPSSPVTRGQLAKIVSNAAGFNESHIDQSFEDVTVGSTFYDFVERLASREIIGGYACGGAGEPCGSDNLPYFRSNAQVTRGQTSKIVAIADNLPAPTPGQQTFEDVAPNSTFWQWVESLATAGTIGGYPCGGAGEPCGSGNLPYFRPSSDVTRGQAAKIVSNTFFPDCQAK